MPISETQIERFKGRTLPEATILIRDENPIFRGKEALVTRVVARDGKSYAFKWYASLEGKTVEELVEYGRTVNQDETLLSDVGLGREMVVDTDFWVGEFDNRAQLYAIQRWSEGQLLKDVSFWKIIKNPTLRRNLADIFISCERSCRITGRQPDLTGGKRIKLFGKDVVEPLVFIWPFRTTNILVEDSKAILVDAKAIVPHRSLIKRTALLTNRVIAQIFARSFLMVDKIVT